MKKTTAISTLLLFITASSAHAQEVIYKLAAPLPGQGGEQTEIGNFTEYVQYLFPFLLSIASVLALVMFTLGAIQYMFSEGGEGNKDGKDRMTSAIMGLLLAAGSVLILETINPNLIILKIDIQQRTSEFVGPMQPGGGFLLGIFGRNNDEKATVIEKNLCGNDTYGECPSEHACLINPVGDYYCASVTRAICPEGASCTPCSQRQLEECAYKHTGATACIAAKTTSGNSTICSYE